jgi:hypothetical protein
MNENNVNQIGQEFSKEEYFKVFRRIRFEEKVPENVLQMLQNHYSAPERTMTPNQLANSVGYKNYGATNLHYGILGKMVCDLLGFIPPKKKENGDPIWTCGLAWGNRETPESEWEWTMYENLALAIKELEMVK